jgi:hypothetical protein
MFIKNGINSLNANICDYYHNSVDYIGSAAHSWKDLRNDISFSQKMSILQKACIEFFNEIRGTNQLIKLAAKLDATFVTDIWDPVKAVHEWFKPYNSNSVHANELLDKLVAAYTSHCNLEGDSVVELKGTLKLGLEKFLNDLNNPGPDTGRQFGYWTSSKFLTVLQDHLSKVIVENPSEVKFDLAEAVGDIPLKYIPWSLWIANRIFNYVGIMTVVYYSKEWDFIDTGRLAANIGKLPILSWVKDIEFSKGFKIAILTGYAALLADAGSKLYKSIYKPQDPSLGPVAKQNAPWDVAYNALECAFYAIGVVGIFKSSPTWIILSVFAAKLTGCLGSVNKKSDHFDTPSGYGVAEPSLISRIKTKIATILAPITHQRHIAIVLQKISAIAEKILSAIGTVFDYLYELVDLSKDGLYKFYKSLLPKLSIADRLLALKGKDPLFTKCRSTLDKHMKWISMSKIVTSIPNWIVRNPEVERFSLSRAHRYFRISSPLHAWDAEKKVFKLKLTEAKRWVTALGDFSNLLDTFKFLRDNEVYHFNYFVEIGSKISEAQIPFFGAYVKDIPILQQIARSPKNIPVVAAALIDMSAQLYNRIVKGRKSEFNFENSCKFAGNIGKIAIIAWDAPGLMGFDILSSFTGDAGLIKYWIGQSKAKKKFNAPLAA